jgi:hypothetical protein
MGIGIIHRAEVGKSVPVGPVVRLPAGVKSWTELADSRKSMEPSLTREAK